MQSFADSKFTPRPKSMFSQTHGRAVHTSHTLRRSASPRRLRQLRTALDNKINQITNAASTQTHTPRAVKVDDIAPELQGFASWPKTVKTQSIPHLLEKSCLKSTTRVHTKKRTRNHNNAHKNHLQFLDDMDNTDLFDEDFNELIDEQTNQRHSARRTHIVECLVKMGVDPVTAQCVVEVADPRSVDEAFDFVIATAEFENNAEAFAVKSNTNASATSSAVEQSDLLAQHVACSA